jgi:hypothetical protein
MKNSAALTTLPPKPHIPENGSTGTSDDSRQKNDTQANSGKPPKDPRERFSCRLDDDSAMRLKILALRTKLDIDKAFNSAVVFFLDREESKLSSLPVRWGSGETVNSAKA